MCARLMAWSVLSRVQKLVLRFACLMIYVNAQSQSFLLADVRSASLFRPIRMARVRLRRSLFVTLSFYLDDTGAAASIRVGICTTPCSIYKQSTPCYAPS